MKYISICSGIEAASVAWHDFGWTPLAFSEIEAFPSAVLAARWPNVPNLGDMTKFVEWPEDILAECDLLVGGPPCQAFSVAGLRRSLDDDRGNITLAYVRLLNHIDEVRKRHGRPPAIAVYENVPGLLSTKDNAFGCLIGAIAGCDEAPETETGKWPKAGYVCGETRRVGYRVLDAQFFGVAQRRRRIFLVAVPCELVASLGEGVCPSEILSLRESMRGNPPTRGKAWEGIARSTTASLTGSGRGVERNGESRGQDDVVVGLPDPAYAISAGQQGKGGVFGSGRDSQDTSVARGAAAVGISGQCAGTLDSHYFKGCGSAAFGEREVVAISAGQQGKDGVAGSGRDSQDTFVAFGGNRSSGPIEVAASILAHGGPCGRQDFASETFVTQPYSVANCLTQRMHKGMNTTVDEGQTPVIVGDATCFKPLHFTRGKDGKPSSVCPPLSADADKGDQDTVVCATGQKTPALTTRAACEEDGTGRGNPIVPVQPQAMRESGQGFWMKDEIAGTLRAEGENRPSRPSNVITQPTNAVGYGKENDGLGITEEGTGPLQRCNTPAVAYVKATNPHSKEEAPRYEEAAVSACINGWDERHDPPKHMVAFTQNSRSEVRQIGGDGQITGALSAESGSQQSNYIAFANRTRDGVKVPEIMKDGVVPALTNPGEGGRSDAINVMVPQQAKGFSPLQGGRSMPVTDESPTLEAGSGNKTPAVMYGVDFQNCVNTGEVSGTLMGEAQKKGDQTGHGVLGSAVAMLNMQGNKGGAGAQADGPSFTLNGMHGHDVHAVASGTAVRRLTPRECERLQGFPDDYTLVNYRGKPACDGPRYKALGNSMAVPCMFWIGFRIFQATNGDSE